MPEYVLLALAHKRAAWVFAINELAPLQEQLMELNDWVGEEVVSFRPYELLVSAC